MKIPFSWVVRRFESVPPKDALITVDLGMASGFGVSAEFEQVVLICFSSFEITISQRSPEFDAIVDAS